MPCSTPSSATVSIVVIASANSTWSNRAIARSSPTRTSRVAMNSRIPARAASGTSCSSAGGRDQRDHALRRQQACELGAAPGLGHCGRARRAGVDRESADQPGKHVAGADAEQIDVRPRGALAARDGIRALVAAVCVTVTSATSAATGASCPSALQRDPAQTQLRWAVSDVPEDRDAVVLQVEDRHQCGRRQRARPALRGSAG